MNKIRAIIKRPDETFGHVTHISDSLENLQRIVDGHIQMIPMGETMAIICNDDGKLIGLPYNCRYGIDTFVGTIIAVGIKGEEMADCPLTMSQWKQILHLWGNQS